ncbi:MAG: cation:proton antiporter, partial [Alphaproteobacteria bacterium]|nr:cation:proton antiporter [Alphaproteobacteria bacterium]
MSISVLLFIAIAFGAVVLMRLGRMGTLLAFLLTGVLIGPHILDLFELTSAWNSLGELGIIFLWFTIGLQINMSRLWQLRKTIFGFGAAQVMMVAVMLFPILFGLTEWTMTGTVMIALMLAMSSTSEDMQILLDRNQMQTATGRQAFSILLFQDLLSIPLLAFLPVLSGVSLNLGATAIDVLVTSVILILGVIIVSKFIISPLMRLVSKLKSNEAFVLAVVVCIIGCCYGFHLIGLTPALGAFLAGMLMSESIFHHQ